MTPRYVATIPLGQMGMGATGVLLVWDDGVPGVYRVAVLRLGAVYLRGVAHDHTGTWDGAQYTPDDASLAPYVGWVQETLRKTGPRPKVPKAATPATGE